MEYATQVANINTRKHVHEFGLPDTHPSKAETDFAASLGNEVTGPTACF